LNYIAIIEETRPTNLKFLMALRTEPLPEPSIWKIIKCLMEALEVWHSVGIVHNRVKCSSVYSSEDGSYVLGEPDILYLLTKEVSFENMCYQSQETLE
jgi:hypothetical protein